MQNEKITPESDIVLNNFLNGLSNSPEVKNLNYRLDMASEYIKTFYGDFNLPESHILRLFSFIANGVEKNISKQTARLEKINQASELLEEGCKKFLTNNKYSQYLDMVTNFNNYSARNIMLILMQKPDAKFVTSSSDWKNKYKRYVNKGEKALMIYAPLFKNEKELIEKKDPITGDIITGKNGLPIQEETGRVKKTMVGFTTVPVFDISQTNGEPLPELANKLTADVKNYGMLKVALESMAPCPIKYDALDPNVLGIYNDKSNEIHIDSNLSESQTLAVLIHEEVWAMLHKNSSIDKATKEVQAESIAYIVNKLLNLDTSVCSFDITSWSQGRDFKELMQSMDVIIKQSNKMLDKISKAVSDLTVEQNKKLSDIEMAKEHIKNYLEAEELGETDFSNLHKVDLAYTELETSNNKIIPIQISVDLVDYNINIYLREQVIDQKHYNSLDQLNRDVLSIMTFDTLIEPAYNLLNEKYSIPEINYTIYQLDTANRDLRFAPFDKLKKSGKRISLDNYKEVYSGSMRIENNDLSDALEKIFTTFNMSHPNDFKGHSLSVSDIIAIDKDGNKKGFYYVDTVGFKDISNELEYTLSDYILANLPDDKITIENRNKYGYTDNHLLPLSKEKALELYDKDILPVYRLYEDNTEGMVETREEIENFNGIFGVETQDWENHLNSLKFVEDSIEQNDNNFDGIINNLPPETTSRQLVTQSDFEQLVNNYEREVNKSIDINLNGCIIKNVTFDDKFAEINDKQGDGFPLLLINFAGAVLEDCVFTDKVMPKNMSDAVIKNCVFNGTALNDAMFSNAKLDSVDFINSYIANTSFDMANLNNITFNACSMETNDFLLAELYNVKFKECNISPEQYNVMTINCGDMNIISALRGENQPYKEGEQINGFKDLVAQAEGKLSSQSVDSLPKERYINDNIEI